MCAENLVHRVRDDAQTISFLTIAAFLLSVSANITKHKIAVPLAPEPISHH